MSKIGTLDIKDTIISITKIEEEDYICLTDMAKAKEGNNRAADVIKNWIRTRTTIEFLGTWETIYNPNFIVAGFNHFKMEAGLPTFVLSPKQWAEKNYTKDKEWLIYAEEADLLNVALFNCTAKDWRTLNQEQAKKDLNIRDFASINELAVLSNIESLNAELIKKRINKTDRFMQLREMAVYQLEILDKKNALKALKKLANDVYIKQQKKLSQ